MLKKIIIAIIALPLLNAYSEGETANQQRALDLLDKGCYEVLFANGVKDKDKKAEINKNIQDILDSGYDHVLVSKGLTKKIRERNKGKKKSTSRMKTLELLISARRVLLDGNIENLEAKVTKKSLFQKKEKKLPRNTFIKLLYQVNRNLQMNGRAPFTPIEFANMIAVESKMPFEHNIFCSDSYAKDRVKLYSPQSLISFSLRHAPYQSSKTMDGISACGAKVNTVQGLPKLQTETDIQGLVRELTSSVQ